jgi:hypothetical protein
VAFFLAFQKSLVHHPAMRSIVLLLLILPTLLQAETSLLERLHGSWNAYEQAPGVTVIKTIIGERYLVTKQDQHGSITDWHAGRVTTTAVTYTEHIESSSSAFSDLVGTSSTSTVMVSGFNLTLKWQPTSTTERLWKQSPALPTDNIRTDYISKITGVWFSHLSSSRADHFTLRTDNTFTSSRYPGSGSWTVTTHESDIVLHMLVRTPSKESIPIPGHILRYRLNLTDSHLTLTSLDGLSPIILTR